MGKNPLRIDIADIPEGKNTEDYPEDTLFVLDDYDEMMDDAFWDSEFSKNSMYS